jgi:hypothetical protein
LSKKVLANGTPHGCAITEHDSTIRRAHSIGRKSRPLAHAATDAPAEDLFVLGEYSHEPSILLALMSTSQQGCIATNEGVQTFASSTHHRIRRHEWAARLNDVGLVSMRATAGAAMACVKP